VSASSVHAVVIAYNAPAQLSDCLAGLDRRVPVTVVDNSSSPEVAAVAERHGAAYVDPGRNLGFGAGVNAAMSHLAGHHADVVLVNPDAVVTPETIDTLTQFLYRDGNDRLAAVAPRLLDAAGAEQQLVWPFPSPPRMWAEALGIGRLLKGATFVVGAVLLLRREAIEDVGLFDERFFLYAEETDWQRRARRRGWTSAVCVDAVAAHAGAGTSTDSIRRDTLFHAAQETYIRKWYGPAGWWLYRLAACLGAGARTVVLTDGRRAEAARRAMLYLRGPRRCAALEQD
jgi:GT2 family glycosyltransferase